MLYTAEKWNVKSESLYYNIRSALCLLVLYTKVHCGPNLQHHGAANREKQLIVTLVVVTLVSLVTWQPGVVLFGLVQNQIISYHQMSFEWNLHIAVALSVMKMANSLGNPILYAVRMEEFRKIVSTFPKIFRTGRISHHSVEQRKYGEFNLLCWRFLARGH